MSTVTVDNGGLTDYAVELGAGVTTADTQRVTIATDGNVVNTGLTQPLTDTELRATPVPVSGTVTANLAAGTNNIGDVDVLTVPAPLSTSGHGTAAAALRVELPTDGTGVIATVGAVTAISNALPAGNNNIGDVDIATMPAITGSVTVSSGSITATQGTGTNLHTVVDSGSITVTQGTGTNLHTVIDSGTTTVTQGTGTNLHTVLDSGTLTSITNTVTTKEARAATSAVTTVASSASNVTLLASNANRLGASIFNDSGVVLYLKLGATATTSSHTVQLTPTSQYYEVPSGYTGIIDGIWASASGNARITELTA